jgi:hypothetical protein
VCVLEKSPAAKERSLDRRMTTIRRRLHAVNLFCQCIDFGLIEQFSLDWPRTYSISGKPNISQDSTEEHSCNEHWNDAWQIQGM